MSRIRAVYGFRKDGHELEHGLAASSSGAIRRSHPPRLAHELLSARISTRLFVFGMCELEASHDRAFRARVRTPREAAPTSDERSQGSRATRNRDGEALDKAVALLLNTRLAARGSRLAARGSSEWLRRAVQTASS